jgi:general secretion pathway protein G
MKRKPTRRQHLIRSAFTLMEVMLVLVIIAAIASLVITNLGSFQDRANKRVATSKVNVIKNAVTSYKIEMRSLPADLVALHSKPSNVANANDWMQFLTEPAGADPWGNNYEFAPLEGGTFEVRSLGPDGTRSDDDIVVAGN